MGRVISRGNNKRVNRRFTLFTKSFVSLSLFIAGTIADLLKPPVTLCDILIFEQKEKHFKKLASALPFPQSFTRPFLHRSETLATAIKSNQFQKPPLSLSH